MAVQAAWAPSANLYTSIVSLTLPTSANTATTTITFTSARTSTFFITFGICTLDNKFKNKLIYDLLAHTITSTGFLVDSTIPNPTDIRKIELSILVHDDTFTSLLAMTSINYPNTDLTVVNSSATQNSYVATYDFSSTGKSFDTSHTLQLFLFAQGVNYDPNGNDYSLKMDGTILSGTTLKIQITTLIGCTIADIVYGVLIFDRTSFNINNAFVDSFWKSATNDVYSDLNIVVTAVTTSIVFGMRSYTLNHNSNLEFTFSTVDYTVTGPNFGFALLQMDFWGYRERVQCSTGFTFISSTSDQCTQICGDGLIFSQACDDGNTNDGDGCSSTCTVEPNFVCSGQPSVCIDTSPVDTTLTLLFTKKQQNANKIIFSFKIEPVLSYYNDVNFTSQLTINKSAVTLTATCSNGYLTVDADYTASLQGQTILLTLDLQSTGLIRFTNTPAKSSSFLVDPDNNLPAILYDSTTYSNTDIMTILSWVVMALALLAYVGCLFFRKYIGFEMLNVIQVAYIAAIIVRYWPPLLSVYAQYHLINGYNVIMQSSYATMLSEMPINLVGMDIGPYFSYTFNISLIILCLPYLIGLVLYLLSKRINNKTQQLIDYGWKSITVFACLAALFNMYQWEAALWTFCFYTKSIVMPWFAIDLVILLISLMSIVPPFVFFGKFPQKFADFKDCFNSGRLQQNHYWILVPCRYVLGTALVLGNSFKYIGFVCEVFPIGMIVLLAVKKPYRISYDNYRAIANEVIIFLILGIYAFFGAFVDYTMHSEKYNQILPYLLTALLILCIIINLITMVLLILKKSFGGQAKEQPEKGDEVKQPTKKDDEATQKEEMLSDQNEEMNKELLKKVADLNRNQSNVNPQKADESMYRYLDQLEMNDRTMEMVRKDQSKVLPKHMPNNSLDKSLLQTSILHDGNTRKKLEFSGIFRDSMQMSRISKQREEGETYSPNKFYQIMSKYKIKR